MDDDWDIWQEYINLLREDVFLPLRKFKKMETVDLLANLDIEEDSE